MLFEFKSRATGSIIMTEAVGKRMLEVMGKAPDPKGIVTIEQLPGAIDSLRAAIEAERQEISQLQGTDASADGDDAPGGHEPQTAAMIRFSQRAAPLIEMFERSLAAGRDVTWGV